jgi:hypothetical protein
LIVEEGRQIIIDRQGGAHVAHRSASKARIAMRTPHTLPLP